MTLRKVVRERILTEMLGSLQEDWMVLVADAHATSVLSAACRNSDVLERKVTLVESLARQRQPLPTYTALYFVAPTDESVSLVIRDWEEPPIYAKAHLFFTDHIPGPLLDKIGNSRLAPRLCTLKELYLDVRAVESAVFVPCAQKDGSPLPMLPLPMDSSTLQKAAREIVTLLYTLKERPIVRHQNSPAAAALAQVVTQQLDAQVLTSTVEPRGTLLLLDRSVDLAAPLLHEFTYQAMLYDLVRNDLRGVHYTHTFVNNGGNTVVREVLLDEYDPLWVEFRHRHISEAAPEIAKSFQQFAQSTKGALGMPKRDSREMDMSKLAEAVRAIPQHQEKANRFSLHINLVDRLMTMFRVERLEPIALLEQSLATGELPDGSKPNEAEQRKELDRILLDANVSVERKLRLILLYGFLSMKSALRYRLPSYGGKVPLEPTRSSHFASPDGNGSPSRLRNARTFSDDRPDGSLCWR
eukprot:NODE_434_length_2255_cov_23.200816_g400_i0.p1 GENE.NODE_434_length_2255_cov_23.200816_g400_i0~~NODE_434_length_2255_cov_23.200816_g400_i0.p1  ORF type:complete len:469 (+),score=82.09 NODE_434_length_2255_cov_23.200816_g400_i0:135-1541(+)